MPLIPTVSLKLIPIAPKTKHLTNAQRAALPLTDFVFPAKAPGVGSYPIPDRAHAIWSLYDSKGKPEAARVAAVVKERFNIG